MEANIEQVVDEKFKEHKNELLMEIQNMFRLSTEKNVNQLNKISKLINSDVPKFKRKSNEEQFKLNKKVITKMEEARETEDIGQARELINEATEILAHRQKLILMADANELGWRLVTEYEANPLAEDSDDEKRMFKAEARAARKLKSERGKRPTRGRHTPYQRNTRRPGNTQITETSTAPAATSTQTKPGLCFLCGRSGHWKNECPGNGNNKMSIITNICYSLDSFDVSKPCTKQESQRTLAEDGIPKPSPVGRLKEHVSKWKEISTSDYIIDVIEVGYKLPFKTLPERVILKNNKSSLLNPDFVTKEIVGLLERGVVQEVKEPPYIVNPLTVAYGKSGKPRLVLDCRHINEHLHLFKIKFEDIKTAEALFQPNSFVYTFDLKSAYHHIDIFDEHRKFLGFSWEIEGEKRYFVYCSLPFGISTAGHIFTKTFKVVVAYLRTQGHKLVTFLDDGIGGHTSYDKAKQSSQYVQTTIQEFGFLLALEKCNWEPSKLAVWLGYLLDFERNKLYIKSERILRLETVLQSVLDRLEKEPYPIISVKSLASIVGQIISLQFVIGNIVQMFTRHMYNCVTTRASWNSPVLVSDSAISEMLFWKNNVRKLNDDGRKVSEVASSDISLYCDASAKGYGGYLEVRGNSTLSVTPDLTVTGEYGLGSKGLALELGKRLPEVSNSCQSVRSNFNKEPHGSGNGLPEASTNISRIYNDSDIVSKMVRLPEVSIRCESRKTGDAPGTIIGNKMLPVVSKDKQDKKGKQTHSKKISLPELRTVRQERNDHKVFGSWSDSEALQSSTWRETETVRRLIHSNVNTLKDKHLKVYSDNKNTTSIILKGSKNVEIHDIATDITNICNENNISLSTEWIPRAQNVEADMISRWGDSDDWYISSSWFEYLDNMWGPHTVDRFASVYNKQCKVFNSRWWVPGTSGVDALSQCWSNDRNWIVPPPRLVASCLKKMEREQAKGTLIVPHWCSSPFWPCIVKTNGDYMNFITGFKLLPRHGVVYAGNGNNGIFGNNPLPFNMLALRISF